MHSTDDVTCVDDFERYGKCVQFKGRGISTSASRIQSLFRRNVVDRPEFAGRASGVRLIEGDIWREAVRLASEIADKERDAFHVVVVDHAPSASESLEWAELGLRLLRPDGILVLTNYTHAKEHDSRCPRPGIDAFMNVHAHKIRVLRTGWHVFIQKRAKPLALPTCQSEYFDPHPADAKCA